MFSGGSEFRFFDLRSLNYPGRNVASVNKTVKPYEVYVATDKSHGGEAYSQIEDLNGNFMIDNMTIATAFTNYTNKFCVSELALTAMSTF
jgi:hypothetical protein